jgi:hypothetical protein
MHSVIEIYSDKFYNTFAGSKQTDGSGSVL